MVHLTDEQRQQIVDAAAESIRATAIENATRDLTGWIRSAVQNTVDTEVNAVLKTEIVPLVKAEILANKSVLVSAAVAAAGEIAEALRAAMVQILTKKLATDWERNKIIEALFK